MQLSDKRIQEMKDLLEKEPGKEVTWEEASDAAYNLAGLAEICFESWQEECRRNRKLLENPKGFKLDGVGYTCHICHDSTRAGGNWFDKYGIKCLICQGAIDRKEIPASIAKNEDSWYSKHDLERAFNLKGPILKSWIKQGIIKVRNILSEGGSVHYQVFLIKDNKDFLPPKNIVGSQAVVEEKDGKTWYRSEPWYRFKGAEERIKGYKIMDHMQFTKEKKE